MSPSQTVRATKRDTVPSHRPIQFQDPPRRCPPSISLAHQPRLLQRGAMQATRRRAGREHTGRAMGKACIIQRERESERAPPPVGSGSEEVGRSHHRARALPAISQVGRSSPRYATQPTRRRPGPPARADRRLQVSLVVTCHLDRSIPSSLAGRPPGLYLPASTFI